MIEIKQRDNISCNITGDNIKELIDVSLTKIRLQSREYYMKEIEKDLLEEKNALVDRHAGMGYYYHIKLI